MAEDPETHAHAGLVRSRFKDKIVATLGRIPFAEEAIAAYFCAMDGATPKHVKAAIFGALAYFIVPTDTIPDFIAALGYTDDAAVFWGVWRLVQGHVLPHHQLQAADFLRSRNQRDAA